MDDGELMLVRIVTRASAGLFATVWCAFGPQLHLAARRRTALVALAALARRQGGARAAGLVLVAGALEDLLDALGLPEDATEAAGARAHAALARALGAAGLPKTEGGVVASAAAVHALAGTQPDAVFEAARKLAELCVD